MTATALPFAIPAEPTATWSIAKRLTFRFAFVYLILYSLPFPLMMLREPWQNLWNAIVPAVATSVFGVAADVLPNGSGDTTWNYVQVFCFASFALLATLLWTALTRAKSHPKLYAALRIYVRFSLAMVMVQYGAVKVIQAQFPSPTLERLVQPYGASSPMGILWTFMGVSAAYNLFAGLGEVIGGVLLTMRRTTLAGALLSLAVMGHVAILNYCYDVPVKLFSTHLVLMALFLAAPDLPRVLRFFTEWSGGHGKRWLVLARTVVVAGFVGYSLFVAQQGRTLYGDLSPRSPLRGIWNVDELTVDGVSRPPLVTDASRWRRVIFDNPRFSSIYTMDDVRQRFASTLTGKTLELTDRDDPQRKIVLTYARVDAKTLRLEGKVDGKQIAATCHLQDEGQFLLKTRGFHWTNEYPFNR
ncbi:MAG TPA: hypothetical protein VF618_06685 [Thermoanaerobaculia bacterium]